MNEETCPLPPLQTSSGFELGAPGETFQDVHPTREQIALLTSYSFNLRRGHVAVLRMITADLQRLRELGGSRRAADLAIVLHLFHACYPGVKCFEHARAARTKQSARTTGEDHCDSRLAATA